MTYPNAQGPQYPQYPQGPQYPTYPTVPAPVQAPPAPAAPPAAPAAPVQAGSLSDFFGQPSSAGGPALKFNNKPIGTSYTGRVARAITDADVRVQTDQAGRPVTFRDGRPKYVLVVPLIVAQSAEFPEGVASWWVKGQARDELARAMAEAGAPAGPPEKNATITVTLVGHRQIPGLNPQFLYRVEYRRPEGAVQAEQQVPAAQPEQTPDGLNAEQLSLLQQLTGNGS